MNLDARTHQILHPLAATVADEYWLTIPFPTDTWAMPLYDGPPSKVHEVLMFGRYKAIIENLDTEASTELTVYVFDNSTILGRNTLGAK